MKEIVCSDCRIPMTEGFILDKNLVQQQETLWVEGDGKETSFWENGVKTRGKEVYKTKAFRCPNCNYLKIYTTERVYI